MTRLPPYEVAGGLSVVTGAASGIGEQLAFQLVDDLPISDVLRTELHDHGVGVTTGFPAGVRTRIATNARRAAHLPVEKFEADRDLVGHSRHGRAVA